MQAFNVPTREEVSPANQALFDNLKSALGFVPNLYATIAYSDNGLNKYLAFQGAKTSLSNREKEAVNLVVSEVNHCRYCQSAHTVIGKMNGFSEEEVLNIRGGHSFNAKLDALVQLAKAITEHKGKIDAAILQAFYDAGYNNGNLVDVILQISDKIAMNYLHNLTEIPIDFPVAPELKVVETV
ncbi:MAG: carboxymuconolactone decarboxylase family protein [Saprospiraceae bacterium]|nr:carboxymuconolactone decarboxylase family protein [Saprospiraceae bacterium]